MQHSLHGRLATIDLQRSLAKAEYKRRMPGLQRRLHELQRACHDVELGSLVVFEGWHGSGTATTIRKLTERLEPRALQVQMIREPRTHELPMPWLWRFWTRLPAWGQIGIFNGSWYTGAVTARGDGNTDDRRWERQLGDIAKFERTLSDDRYLVMKFFFHLDRDEHRRRLEKLAADPLTMWRVQDEHWERLEERERYEEAVEDALELTDAGFAPWTLVPATDRRLRRAIVLEVLVARLEAALEARGHDLSPYAQAELDTDDTDDTDRDEERDEEPDDGERQEGDDG